MENKVLKNDNRNFIKSPKAFFHFNDKIKTHAYCNVNFFDDINEFVEYFINKSKT
jgi:hypothetical protein